MILLSLLDLSSAHKLRLLASPLSSLYYFVISPFDRRSSRCRNRSNVKLTAKTTYTRDIALCVDYTEKLIQPHKKQYSVTSKRGEIGKYI